VENKELYECQNCGFTDDVSNLPMAKDLAERHTPGDTFSEVECPHCGALCFPVKDESANDNCECRASSSGFVFCSLHGAAPAMLSNLEYVDAMAPCQPGDGSSPLDDSELVEITITGRALKDLRAAIAQARKEGSTMKDQLIKLGFHSLSGYEAEYEDFERYPKGYGSDGEARTERVTIVDGKDCYATIRDVEPNGEETLMLESKDHLTVEQAVEWLEHRPEAEATADQ
jgi:predicted RNA-binding Zn-ribbon protein involved in translation (DUF1610 family)